MGENALLIADVCWNSQMGFLSYDPIITCEVHVLGTPTSDKHVVVVLFEGLSKHSGFTGYTALTN